MHQELEVGPESSDSYPRSFYETSQKNLKYYKLNDLLTKSFTPNKHTNDVKEKILNIKLY